MFKTAMRNCNIDYLTVLKPPILILRVKTRTSLVDIEGMIWNDERTWITTFQFTSFYLIAIFSVSMLGFGTYVFLKCIENPILWLSIILHILVLVLIIVLTRMYMKD